ncbi:glucagon family neuropeptides-like isoform X2 [Petromyzon marinus]|uniref:VIP peptides-like isoform X2 n=1 Tax=Petromyzon marinus TaxID=7757 RepID=A0AAJ7WUH7_PETMA|nr:VIP peptides-like isoform X2 [Petromyzon marinus]
MSPMRSFQATVAAVCLVLTLHCPGRDSFPATDTDYFALRPERHADALFHNNYKKLLGQMSARRYFESLLQQGKRIDEEEPPFEESQASSVYKRHSDAVFTDLFSRLRKQQAAEKMMSPSEQGDSLVPSGELDFAGLEDYYEPGTLRDIVQHIAEGY